MKAQDRTRYTEGFRQGANGALIHPLPQLHRIHTDKSRRPKRKLTALERAFFRGLAAGPRPALQLHRVDRSSG